MEQFVEFAGNHPILFAAFGGIVGLLIWTTMQTAGGNRLAPADAIRLINHEEAVVLDVRSDAEFQTGHIVGAVHIPEGQLDTSMNRLQKYRSKPVITACRTGQRSAAVSAKLRNAGFEQVFNLSGGIVAWEGANLPLTRR
ncbi:MAG: rhodanese-like domain-containing protein [Gammaproteobacteria bacterium]|nr:rhodanese-like domain-containing protein [Gammaproteobacteria bacterium]